MNILKAGNNLPSTLQTLLDLHHDLIEERLHITSNSGSGVSNRNEGYAMRSLNISSRSTELAYQNSVHWVCQIESRGVP
jgi:hypothetical protein